ncbi:hypothetical protein BLA28_02750 [Eisenbergiella tayi]|nr:hypothetical protein BLA28_02750 [Eisenbergiella tayi]RJW35584.1 hypothetical protein DXC97_22010 [Lachnospiraceae bacterium TF09-5]
MDGNVRLRRKKGRITGNSSNRNPARRAAFWGPDAVKGRTCPDCCFPRFAGGSLKCFTIYRIIRNVV